MEDYDVIVVGAGNAALSAAVSAHENGARRVLVLEKAPRDMRGGNTHWAGAVLRIAFDAPRELAPLLPGIEEQYESFYEGIAPSTRKDYMDDLLRVTSGRTDPVLSSTLVDNSHAMGAMERLSRHADRRRLGRLRAARVHRPLQPLELSLRPDDQPPGAPLRRRGRGPEPPHLRQVRAGDPRRARRQGLPAVRQQGAAPAGAA